MCEGTSVVKHGAVLSPNLYVSAKGMCQKIVEVRLFIARSDPPDISSHREIQTG